MFRVREISVILAAVASIVVAHPSSSRRQDSGSFIHVTGATGNIDWRQEVFTLQSDAAAWNIYLLALERFQNMSASDPLSWYQIAGIHGQPYVAWDDVGPCSNCTMAGYCTHQSTLFPTWHRPYLALFEQSLINNAIAAANEFSGDDKTLYLEKANVIRMPFWDWAQVPAEGQDPFPQIFTQQTVTVTKPSGQVQIENPLLQYRFKDGEDSSFLGGGLRVTTRKPEFTLANRRQLRTDLWTLLSSQVSYNSFSTEALIPGDGNFNPTSLEALHDNVHVMTGGQMQIVPQAAFDPVFWLHHAMIDHIFAIWQAAHPNEWLQPWSEVGSSMTYASGTIEGAQSDLTPFHSSTSGGFYNSDQVKDTKTFTYLYADLASGRSAADIINSLYRDSQAPVTKRSPGGGRRGQPGHFADYINQVMDPNSGRKIDEYIANIEVDSQSMEGSFTIFLFDGPFDESKPDNFYNEENLIGSHGFFSSPHAHGDGSNRVNAGISLTGSLIDKLNSGALGNLDSTTVTNFLKEKIEWRIVKADGSVVDEDDVPGLQIAILTSKVQLPGSEGGIPQWGDFNAMPDVTRGRRWGFNGEWNGKWHGHGPGQQQH